MDSNVVVECLSKDVATVQSLVQEFAFDFMEGLDMLFSQDQEASSEPPKSLLRYGIDGLANLSKGSRVFRDAIRNLPNIAEILQGFKRVFSKDFAKKLDADPQRARDLKFLLTSVIAALAFSADSQIWLLDVGLLDILCAVYESTHRREIANLLVSDDPSGRQKIAASRCNTVLLRLVETEEALKKLQQLNALSRLKVHKDIINAASPESEVFWGRLKAGLSGKVPPNLRRMDGDHPWPGFKISYSDERWRFARRHATSGAFPTRTVCSWKLSTAGPEPDSGGFSRCARCQVARYCSKEHQKLHWRTHRKHCQAQLVITNAEAKPGRKGGREARWKELEPE
ncbi:hypothetical protein KFL_000080020 [Klebsormidium nitens]|uniref:MYND-type domain-containing protein n=1 Tax=Klebsormidium nitens TaxID=105231 RepID=A0A1Y1HQJ0_KLENI|nr:hypothetical protein KFL_000080020 [Klebsormidium nitens]|eukprot:GAQ78098.1 hypothetical protein KFL_000080020 [Klebsormidium nitens]